jgi:hypothetical protein
VPQEWPYAGYPPYGYPYGYPPYGYPPPGTDGYAIASLLCSILLGVVPFLGGGLGITFGVVALRRCARSGARGRGLAVTGIVIGALAIAFWILAVIGLAVGTNSGSTGGSLGALSY